MMSKFQEIVLMKMLASFRECQQKSRLFLHPTNLHTFKL